jgi:hypothetical protein
VSQHETRKPLRKVNGNPDAIGGRVSPYVQELELKIDEDLAKKHDIFEFEPAHQALSREFTELKAIVKRIKESVDTHDHEDLVLRIRELQDDNDDLRSKYASL